MSTLTKKGEAGVKSTSVEMEARISAVYRMLLSGMRRQEIIQYVADKTDWGVCERTLDTYMERARLDIAEVTAEERQTALGMAYKRLDTLYYKSLLINDYKTALAVQKEINDINGIKVLRQEITGKDGEPLNPKQMTDAQLIAAIRAEREKNPSK